MIQFRGREVSSEAEILAAIEIDSLMEEFLEEPLPIFRQRISNSRRSMEDWKSGLPIIELNLQIGTDEKPSTVPPAKIAEVKKLYEDFYESLVQLIKDGK